MEKAKDNAKQEKSDKEKVKKLNYYGGKIVNILKIFVLATTFLFVLCLHGDVSSNEIKKDIKDQIKDNKEAIKEIKKDTKDEIKDEKEQIKELKKETKDRLDELMKLLNDLKHVDKSYILLVKEFKEICNSISKYLNGDLEKNATGNIKKLKGYITMLKLIKLQQEWFLDEDYMTALSDISNSIKNEDELSKGFEIKIKKFKDTMDNINKKQEQKRVEIENIMDEMLEIVLADDDEYIKTYKGDLNAWKKANVSVKINELRVEIELNAQNGIELEEKYSKKLEEYKEVVKEINEDKNIQRRQGLKNKRDAILNNVNLLQDKIKENNKRRSELVNEISDLTENAKQVR